MTISDKDILDAIRGLESHLNEELANAPEQTRNNFGHGFLSFPPCNIIVLSLWNPSNYFSINEIDGVLHFICDIAKKDIVIGSPLFDDFVIIDDPNDVMDILKKAGMASGPDDLGGLEDL